MRLCAKMQVPPTGRSDEQRLADLLFPKPVHDLDLSHGYRGQTHLGSLLMYHEMLLEAEKNGSELQKFIEKLQQTPDARVFVMGSVFGGTGASSIPLVPKILQDVAKKMDAKNDLRAIFGGLLLTNYFSFGANKEQLKNEKVIANSQNFALNSQTALTFYQNDETVEQTYKAMYHIGWPLQPANYQSGDGKILTGGKDQQNPAHPVELMAAFAALDFFEKKSLAAHDKYFAAAKQTTGGLPFFDFDTLAVSPERGKRLEKKLGAMLAFALLLNSKPIGGKMSNLLANLKQRTKSPLIANLQETDVLPLQEYLEKFWCSQSSGKLEKGWFWQLKEQAKYDEFLFKAACYDPNQMREFNWGGIYLREEYNFPLKKKMLGFGKHDHSDAYNFFTETALVGIGINESFASNTQAFVKYFHDGLTKAFQVNG